MKKNGNKKGVEHKPYKIVLVVLIAALATLAIVLRPRSIPLWPFLQEIFVVLVVLFLVSLFIERTVEVLMVVWREKGKQELKSDLALARNNSGGRGGKNAHRMTVKEKDATKNLEIYRAETKTVAIPTAFVLGILVSVLGFRVLQPIVDPVSFGALPSVQMSMFTGMDVLITGALIGGSSKGIHEIIEAFLNMVERYREHINGENK